MVIFPTQIADCDSHSPAVLDLFISSNTGICSTMAFPPLRNSDHDHVVVSVSIGFPSYSQRNALFHCIACDYSHADWDGLHDHLRDVWWEDIFKLCASTAATEFCEWVQVGINDISLIRSITSRLTHILGLQQQVFCFYQKDKSSESKVKFRQASNRCKGCWSCQTCIC